MDAEQALLGALLHNNKVMDRVIGLEPWHFSDPINGRVFLECRKLIESDRVADVVTLRSILENSGILNGAGGSPYLAQLLQSMITIVGASGYAKVIRDTWVRRELIDVGESLVNGSFGVDPDQSTEEIMSGAMESILALGEDSDTKAGVEFSVAATAAVQRAEAAYRGEKGQTRLETGIPAMDSVWGGLWPGQLYYLMARSRTGKTPAMMQIARNVGRMLLDETKDTGTKSGCVHVFSLEMTAEDLATVNLASVTNWTSDQLRSGELGGNLVNGVDPWVSLEQSATDLGRLPIFIDDRGEIDLPGLIMRARAVSRQRRTRLICIDYRELVRRGRDHTKMSLPEWVPYLGYQLKALAKAVNVPVIALAQINKARPGDAPRRPTLDDLPYDGGQAADGVFALHRPELYHADDEPPDFKGDAERQAVQRAAWHEKRDAEKGVAEFGVLKRRFGPANIWKRLRFDAPRMLLSDPNEQRMADPDLLAEMPEWVTE